MKFKEELQLSHRDFGVLKEEITRLNKEQRASNERVKTTEEKYAKSLEELNKISRLVEDQGKSGKENKRMEKESEKDEVILKLNEKINASKNQNVEKMKLEEKLQSSQRECDKLKEEISRLIEDQRLSRREKKRIEERRAKYFAEYLKKTEKDEMILHLNHKIKELENKKLESEHIAEVYEAKMKSLNLMVVQKNGEVDKLKRKKFEADQIVEDLSFKLLAADQNVEWYKKRFEILSARLRKVEQDLANYLNMNANNLKNDAVNVPISGVENRSSPTRRENDDLETGDLENFWDETSITNNIAADDTSCTVVCALKSSTNEMNSVPQRGKQAINIIIDHIESVKKHSENAGCSRKLAKSLNWGDTIKSDESDDEETKQDKKKGKRKRNTYGGKNNENFPTGVEKEKRRRDLTSAGPKSLVNDCFVKSNSVVANQPSHGDITASTDSDDDSISSSHIEDIIASC